VRSLTSGRGRHAEEFSHYAEVAPEFTQKILAERAKRNGATVQAHEK
jgi:translation elongation factor EF-G